MSQSIDSRVVEMRFDNKEFEANARETLNTLENLKRALNENVSGEAFNELDKAARNVDLSGIQAGIETLTDRFSTMGIVGMTVIQNITNALTHTLGNAVSNVFDTIVSGGVKRAQNIENARFQLQGILNDEEKVNEVFKNASESVDGTAYALDSAANAASQLAASGVEAGEQMTNVLKGIAGVAATTSSDYEGISRIFTQVAGNGRLMGDQLLQLSTRGLNAAATLKDYFNGVKNGSIEATDAVKEQIAALTGATDLIKDTTGAISEAAESSYEEAKKAYDKEYKLKQKQYNNEYKALQKSLNEQYNLKKKAYDEEYKALQESLNKEIEAVQEANAQRIEELNEKYQADVEAYREATNQKISLINEEYKESIKLIDEERYEKIKAVDDQIKAIQDQAKAEQKALKDAANAEKKADLESILNKAKSNKTKQQAAQALADFEAELAREQLAEDREKQIENLQEEKNNINEEAQKKKEEAQKKAESAREAVQTESSAELKAMQKAHEEELKQVRKEQQEQLEQMRNSNAERLQVLRESQTEELSIYKEGQNAELEAFRDKQSEELEAFKEFQNEYLEGLKDASGKASKYAAKFGGVMDVTEGDIRDMVSNGLISFDIFSEAMATTFGEHAYDANKTFQGALSNIKAALARTGAMFVTPLISEGAPLIDLLNAIRVKINEFNKALAPVAHYVTDLINFLLPNVIEKIDAISFKSYDFYHVWRGFYAIGEFLVSIFKAIGDGFRDSFDIDTSKITDSAKQFQLFAESIKISENRASKIRKTTKSIIKLFKSLWSVLNKAVNVFKPLIRLFGETSDKVEDVDHGVADTIEKFAEWLESSKLINNTFDVLTKMMNKFVDVIILVKNKVKDLSTNFNLFDVGKQFINGFLNGINSVVSIVYEAITGFANKVLEIIKKIFHIESPSKITFEYGIYLMEGFINGIKSIIDKVFNVISDVFNNISSLIKEKFDNISTTIKELVNRINSNNIDMNGEELGNTFISDFIKGIIDHIPDPLEVIRNFFLKIKEKLLSLSLGEPVGENYTSSFLNGVKNGFNKIVEKIKNIIFKIGDKISSMFGSSSSENGEESGENFILNFIKGIKEKIGTSSGDIFNSISNAFKKLKESLTGLEILGIVTASLTGLILLVNSVKSGFMMKIINAFSKLSKVFKAINFVKKHEEIKNFITGLFSSGQSIGTNINEGFVEGIRQGLYKAINAAKLFAEGILQKIKDVFGIASPAKEIILIAINIIVTFVNTIAKYSKLAWEKVISIFSFLLDKLKLLFTDGFGVIEEHGPELLALTTGLGVLLLITRIIKLLSGEGIFNPFNKIATAIGSLNKVIKATAWDIRATALLKFAGAFVVLTIALATFIWAAQQVENVSNMRVAISGFIILLLSFAMACDIVLKALTKLQEQKWSIFGDDPKENALIILAEGIRKAIKQWSFGKAFKAFAESVAIIVGSFFALIKIINSNDPETIKLAEKILGAIGGFLLVLSVILLISSKKAEESESKINILNNQFAQIAIGFLALAVSFYLIIKTIEEILSSEVSLENQSDKILLLLGVFTIIGLIIGALIYATNKCKNTNKNTLSVAASPIIAVLALMLGMLFSLKKILEMDLSGPDTIEKLKLFKQIFLAIGILAIILSAITANGEGEYKAGGTILALCAFLITAAGVIAILGKFKISTLLKGIIAIFAIMIAVAIAVSSAAGVEPGSFKVILSVLAMLAVCVALMAGISFMEPSNVILATAVVCAVLLSLAVLFSQLAKVNSKKGSNKIWAMIAALVAIGASLWAVSTNDWPSILMAGISISGVLLVYSRIFNKLSKTKVNNKTIRNFVIGSLSILIIGGILTALSTQKWSSILSAGVSISSVLLTYGMIFKQIAEVKITTDQVVNFVMGSLSIAVIGGILTALSTQKWSSILSAGASISSVLFTYGMIFKQIAEVKTTTDQVVNFVIGSVSVAIIGGILTAVATQEWSSILSAGTSVAASIEAYSDAFRKISGTKVSLEDVSNFVIGSLSICLIGCALYFAAQNEWSSILSAGTSISEVLLTYGHVFKNLSGVDVKISDVGKFLLGTVAIAVIAGILWGVTQGRDWAQLLSAGTSISAVLYFMSKAIEIINGISISKDAIGALAAGLVAVFVTGSVLGKAADNDWKGMLGAAISIITVLLGLCVVLGILQLIGPTAEAAGLGILILDGLIIDIAALLWGLGALMEYTSFGDLVDTGSSTLIKLGDSLGQFLYNIVNGLTGPIVDGIVDIGQSLSDFMYNAKEFFTALDNIDENTVKAAESLVGVILAFAISDLINDISGIFGVFKYFTPNFATKFENLGIALSKFAEKTKGINGWNAKNSAEAVKALVETMDSIQLFDFAKAYLLPWFGGQVASFAEYLPTIVDNTKGYDLETYQNVSEALKEVIKVMDSIKSRDFRDAEDLATFGEHLVTFAGYLRSVGKYAADMDPANFENMYNSADWVIGIARLVPFQKGNGNLISQITGNNDIAEFGRKIHSFAKFMGGEDSIQTYASGLDPAIFKNLYNSADWVLKIATAVPETSSGLGKLFVKNDLATFGQHLKLFTMKIVSIQKYLSNNELKKSDFENLKNCIDPVFDITNTLKQQMLNEEGNTVFKPVEIIKNFGESIKQFGKDVKECGEKAINGYPGFSGAIELLGKLITMIPSLESFTGKTVTDFLKNLKEYGINGLENFLNSFTNSKEEVTKAISTMFSNISTEFTNKKDLMTAIGRVIIGYFVTGINESMNTVIKSAEDITSNFRTTISNSNAFKEAGRNAGFGFASGLTDERVLEEVRRGGSRLGNEAYESARRSLDEHSPSRKMMEVGSFAGEGFVLGFLEWVKAASNAGGNIGESAQDGLKEALNNLGKEIQNEDELISPVITPILDLSDIEKNASAISGLLNTDKTVTLAAGAGLSFAGGLNNLLSNIQASIPDNTNDDVILAINGLRDDLNVLSARVNNLQVVMDTGELVGVITDPIDSQLGWNSVLAERGVR